MAEFCTDNAAYVTKVAISELEGMFPDARVVYSGIALLSDKDPGVVILDGTGTVEGGFKRIQINGPCPNLEGGTCRLAEKCAARDPRFAKADLKP